MKAILIKILKVLLVLSVFVGAIAINNYKIAGRSEGASKYTTAEVTYADGSTKQFDNKYFGTVNKGDVVTLHIALPEEAPMPRGTLVFYDYSTTTEVWYGDTLLDSYGEESAAADRMIGNHVFMVDVPDAAWGNEITIVLRPTEDNAFTDFPALKIYPSKDASKWFFDQNMVGIPIIIALFVFAVFGLFALLLVGIRGTALKNGLNLVALALLVSLWLISNTMIYALYRLNFYFWEPLEYITGFSIAIPVLLFFCGMENKNIRWKRILKWAAAAVTTFVAVITILNFTNILHYSRVMNISTILLVACSLMLLVYSIQTRRDKSKTKRMLRTGSYIFVLSCVYEVLIRGIGQYFSVPLFYNLPTLITLGMMLLIMYMIGAFISDLYEKQKDLLEVQIKADTLDKVIATTPAGLCQLVPGDEITIVSANNIFYKIMGYRDAELQEEKPQDAFTHLYDNEQIVLHQKIAEILQSASNEGEFEFTTVDIDKNPQTILFRYYYDRESSGNITVNALDITDRKQMEEDLRLSEERYKLALNQSGKEFFYFDIPTRTARLSKTIAKAFGLPLEVDGLPESFLPHGLLEKESEGNYRKFFERILAGVQSGETIIACHTVNAPEQTLWYKLTFVSVFGKENRPMSTIITYEDVSEQCRAELYSKWRQISLATIPEKEYVIAIYDLTRNRLLSQTGELFVKLPEFEQSYDGTNRYVLENFIHPDDVDALDRFLNLPRLLEQYKSGKTEDQIEYRSLQSGSDYRWTSLTAQMITDPYTGHIMAQLLFQDIHKGKSGQIEITQNMQKLQTELENSRVKVMVGQMQPHFLYNALSAIKMITKTDPKRAYNLIQDFTVHLRSSIHALSSDEPIPFTEEMNNVRAYLNIELARFGNKLHIVYDIRCDDFAVIPLTVQPLVENAVKHGIFPKGKKGGVVTVRSYETDDAYIVEVEDDGLGFDMDKAMEEGNNSYGLKNIVFRLKSLMQADVVFHSTIGSGTLAVVTFPKATQKGAVSE